MRPAVFLDRDDTLIDTHGVTRDTAHPGDLGNPDLVRLLHGVADALARLRSAGYPLIVFSSQGGVARGGYGLDAVEAVNQRLRDLLRAAMRLAPHDEPFAGLYYCPFHPHGDTPPFNTEHDWRKPGPGMILAAARELGLDLARSWAVGDKPRDTEAAINAGIPAARTFVIRTSGEDGPCADLAEAAARILASKNSP